MVFNTFVFLQIFNMINSRKINDEKNPFADITKNNMFIIIWVIIFVLQVLLTQFTGKVFKVNPDGLNWQQWLISLGIGVSIIPFDMLLKCLPDEMCFQLGKSRADPMQDQGVLNLRRQRTESYSLRQRSFDRHGSLH